MFGRQDALPVHGGSKSNNGVSGMPVVNKAVALSLIWVVGSILFLLFGISHCRSNAYSYRLDCSKTDCKFTVTGESPTSLQFPKSDLLEADYMRIDQEGGLADAQRIKNEPHSSFGHSIRLKARLPVQEGSPIKVEKQIVFSKQDMGRRSARSGASRITKYINYRSPSEEGDTASSGRRSSSRSRRSRSDEKVNLYSGRSVTLLGMTSIVVGIMSLIFACLFGQFSEESKRNRIKKAS